MGWPLVPVLRLSLEDKAEELEVQGKAEGEEGPGRVKNSAACKSKVAQDTVLFRFRHLTVF